MEVKMDNTRRQTEAKTIVLRKAHNFLFNFPFNFIL